MLNNYVAESIIITIFAIGNARVAQLVERQPSKLNVASSNLVSRSKNFNRNIGVFFVPIFFKLIDSSFIHEV